MVDGKIEAELKFGEIAFTATHFVRLSSVAG